MLGTILSIVGGISEAINIYKFGSTLAKGDDAGRVLGALDRIHAQIQRLNDHILYAPGVEGLSHTSGASRRLGDLRQARALLEPVQAALGGDIISSGLIEIPDKMKSAMIYNPWGVLEDVRPQYLAASPANPDKIPVLFVHNGVQYIGWQMRGALPMLFNCELRDLPGLGASLTQEANAATATLVVIRPWQLRGGGVSFRLFANGEEIGRIDNNSTEQFTIPAGRILLEAKTWSRDAARPLILDLVQGSRTLIEIKHGKFFCRL